MTSQVAICNAALGKLGQDIAIASMGERTKHGTVFNRIWSRVLDYVLADHAWPFGLSSVALATLAQAPPPGWGYRYAYPADCLDALVLCDAGGVRQAMASQQARYDFEVVHGAQGTSIVTDLAAAYLVYVARIEEVARFPPHFVEALVCRLAWEAAPAVMGELGLRAQKSLLQDYEFAKSKAAAHANNQARDVLQPMTPSLAARQ